MLRLPRDPFVALYAAAVAALVAALLHGERLNPWVQFQRRWLVGVVGGVLLGALLAGTVLSQPRSPAPTGNALALALLWDGGVYGLSDGLHMNVLPVAEFRSSALVAPLIGNTMITVGSLVTGSCHPIISRSLGYLPGASRAEQATLRLNWSTWVSRTSGSVTMDARLLLLAVAGLVGCVRQHVVFGVGDIAVCDSPWDEATARLTDSLRRVQLRAGRQVVVITAGDNVYPRGTAEQYKTCHAPSWGQPALFAITRPAPGNHDYLLDRTAGPYFEYFGERAGPPGLGYYSYQAGSWHVISLNSELRGPAAGEQLEWLQRDLARHRSIGCTLAYWHRPVFSSGAHGNDSTMVPAWQLLHGARTDVVVTGHDHTYERFTPQTARGVSDSLHGVQQFVVGTGGAGPYAFTHLGQAPNSAFHHTGDYGVLVLELMGGRYRWSFITIAGRTLDSGNASCR